MARSPSYHPARAKSFILDHRWGDMSIKGSARSRVMDRGAVLLLIACIGLLLGACGYLPQDPSGAVEPVEESVQQESANANESSESSVGEGQEGVPENDPRPGPKDPDPKPMPLRGTVKGVLDASECVADPPVAGTPCEGCQVRATITNVTSNEIQTLPAGGGWGTTTGGNYDLGKFDVWLDSEYEIVFTVVDPNAPNAVWCGSPWTPNDGSTPVTVTHATVDPEPNFEFRCY